MLGAVKQANLLLTFLLELAVYASVALWGFTVGSSLAVELLAGVGAPLLLGVVWGLLAAPRAPLPLHGPARAALEIPWFGAGVAALAAIGQPGLAIVLAVLYLANSALRLRWHQ